MEILNAGLKEQAARIQKVNERLEKATFLQVANGD